MTQISHVALLGGNREDLAARFDRHALSGWRKSDVAHAIRHVHPPRHHPREIAGGGDLDDVLFAGSRIELVNVAGLLEHD